MWAHIINIILGIWLMASPAVLGYNGTAADNDWVVGPIIGSFAIIALSGCTRYVGRWNIALGAWLLLAPWVLGYDFQQAIWNDMLVGLAIIPLSFVRGRIPNQYGGGWPAMWKSDTPDEEEARNQAMIR